MGLAVKQPNTTQVVAIGECGLDYARLKFCPRDVQLEFFEKQMDLAEATNLPMFFHCRDSLDANFESSAARDFISIIQQHRSRFTTGVVHSFDGTFQVAQQLIDLVWPSKHL